MISPNDVTIIIPHLGGTKESDYALNHCIKSLKETTDIKILVALNGDQCESSDHVWRANLKIKDQGQCKAVNAAVATTNTPWIMVTNDDMVYAPGWFERLIGWQKHGIAKEPICISPVLVEPRPGAPTFIVEFMGGAGGDFDKGKWLEYAKFHNTLDFDLRTGFNLPFLISRELWDTVGGYDIDFDPWGSNSDSDLEYKIKLAGVQPMQNPNSCVYHFSQTSGTFDPKNGAYYQKNFQVFKDKWGFDRTDNGIWEASFEIPNEGRLFRPSWEGKYK